MEETHRPFDAGAEAAARIAWHALWKPPVQRTLAERRALDTTLGNRAPEPEPAVRPAS